jgi:ankyrin repeat protein
MNNETPLPPTPLLAALCAGDRAAALAAIAAGVDINVSDVRPVIGDGATPLHYAAAMGELDLVQALLAAGAAIDARTWRGQTPLWLACNSGASAVARELLAAGADPNARCVEGYSPLARVRASDPALTQVLRSYGAEV